MPEKPEQTDKTIALNVRLIPRDHSDQPILANYSTVQVAQRIAYIDFGFIEPALLGAVVRAAQANKPLPKAIQGKLASRVALPLDALVRLQQQLQQTLMGLQRQTVPRQGEPKGQA